jgi:hypothetical protein
MTRHPVPRARVRARVVVLSLLSALLSSSTIAAQPSEPVAVARNVRVTSVLVPVFDELAQSSPMFRSQCDRIERARFVAVIVVPVMAQSTISRGTARTTMRRYSSGALVARVEIPVPLTMSEYAELFGHEFEHILEQIDRVDLEKETGSGEARRLADGSFETRRARAAGQAIAIEAERPAPGHSTATSGTSSSLRTTAPVTAMKQR